MPQPRLNLIVLRVADIDRSAAFYQPLGLVFDRHSHGAGPEHLAAALGDVVFELYPASDKQPVTASVRIGFSVDDLDLTIQRCMAVPDAKLVSPPQNSEWGYRAVVADPDGHRVELIPSAIPLNR